MKTWLLAFGRQRPQEWLQIDVWSISSVSFLSTTHFSYFFGASYFSGLAVFLPGFPASFINRSNVDFCCTLSLYITIVRNDICLKQCKPLGSSSNVQHFKPHMISRGSNSVLLPSTQSLVSLSASFFKFGDHTSQMWKPLLSEDQL